MSSKTVTLTCDILYNENHRDDYTINFNEASLNNVREIKLMQIQGPVSWYNVSYSNRDITIDEDPGSGGSTIGISLPVGNYEIGALASRIQSDLSGASAVNTYTVTYDTNKLRWTISASSVAIKVRPTDLAVRLGYTEESTVYALNATGNQAYIIEDMVLEVRLYGLSHLEFVNNQHNGFIGFRVPKTQLFGDALNFVNYGSDLYSLSLPSYQSIKGVRIRLFNSLGNRIENYRPVRVVLRITSDSTFS